MARPLRIEFPGAVYHVTSRGDRREPIYRDDTDRQRHLDVIALATDRFDAQVLAYCLMGNHYHLVLHTRQANLSRLMRHINGVYTQDFNRRHGLVGHLFQGRFKAILVDRDAYLLSLCRYVERNPVAAGLVTNARDWPWSSCQAHLGQVPTPPWLDSDGLHGYLLGRELRDARDRRRATERYAGLLDDAAASADGAGFWREALRQQIYLGDDDFVKRMQALAPAPAPSVAEVPRAQRMRPVSLQACLAQHPDRQQAMHAAYREHGFTMSAIARELGLSVSRVSRVIGEVEAGKGEGGQSHVQEARSKT
jgi:putative transposase